MEDKNESRDLGVDMENEMCPPEFFEDMDPVRQEVEESTGKTLFNIIIIIINWLYI